MTKSLDRTAFTAALAAIPQATAPRCLADTLEELPHRYVFPANGNDGCHCPELSVWASEAEECGRGEVVLMMLGKTAIQQSPLFAELSPQEARQLARYLIRTADAIDHLRGRAAADAVRAAGGDAVTAARAHIAETFANSFAGV